MLYSYTTYIDNYYICVNYYLFVIHLVTNKYFEEQDVRTIFPPYIPPTGKGEYFIDFVRLRPKISEDILRFK